MSFIEEKEIIEIKRNFFKNNQHIIVEKRFEDSFYRFLVSLPDNSSLSDLYRQVSLYYSHVKTFILYYDQNKKICIPNSTELIKNYFYRKNIVPCTKYPILLMYRIYIDLHEEQTLCE